MDSRAKHNRHPLLVLADYARWSEGELMDWLQGNGWVSDLCIDVYDVAPCDVKRVLIAASVKYPALSRFNLDDLQSICTRPKQN